MKLLQQEYTETLQNLKHLHERLHLKSLIFSRDLGTGIFTGNDKQARRVRYSTVGFWDISKSIFFYS